jgi:predicted ABC-type ATPase
MLIHNPGMQSQAADNVKAGLTAYQAVCCPIFVNADLIAAGLSPFAPERAAIQAGRLMLQATVRRRFEAGKRLFATIYRPLVDQWVLYDNAGADADLKGSLAAIRRAANRARQVAQQTGTDLIVMRGGQVTRVSPRKKPA